MLLYLFLLPPWYSPISAIFIRETVFRSDHKQTAALSNSSIRVSELCYVVTEIASGCSLLGTIRDGDQTALNIDLAREAMHNEGCSNSRKPERQVRDWKRIMANWGEQNKSSWVREIEGMEHYTIFSLPKLTHSIYQSSFSIQTAELSAFGLAYSVSSVLIFQ